MNDNRISLKKIILICELFILFVSCSNKIKIKVENTNKKYIIKKMTEKLVISLSSSFDKPVIIKVVIGDLIGDYSDMPIYNKRFKIYPGMNYIMINLNEIGTGKFGLRIYQSKKLIDYRIIEVLPEKGNL